jgi:hypothetical protein
MKLDITRARTIAMAVAATIGILSSVPPAAAYDTPARLNEVARVYSLGVGEIRCDSQAEWNADRASRFAWSYTNLRHDYSVVPPFLCEGALNVGGSAVPLWQQAAGTWTLVREAYHLRHWRFRRDEAKVLCQALVYFTEAATRLGATEQQAHELYPYALALHWQTTQLYPWYRDPTCVIPPWILPPQPNTQPRLDAAAAATPAPTEPTSTNPLAHARQIAVEVDTRYPGLRVTEASSTSVIESLMLSDADDTRVVPADHGIYYAVCPNRATCPYPGHAARPATALAPRRVALELALRTFLETSANLVVVSLPTRRFILLVFERDAIDPQRVSASLAPYSPEDTSPPLRSLVDAETLPHMYLPFALVPTQTGRDSLLAWRLALAPEPSAPSATSPLRKPRPALARTRGR